MLTKEVCAVKAHTSLFKAVILWMDWIIRMRAKIHEHFAYKQRGKVRTV